MISETLFILVQYHKIRRKIYIDTDCAVFAGGYAGAVWRCFPCPCPASSATPCSRGSTSGWRPATRPPRPGAVGVQTTATTQPQSTAERTTANSRAPTVLFHRPQTVTRDSWVSQDQGQSSSPHLQSYQEHQSVSRTGQIARTKDQKEQFVRGKESSRELVNELKIRF